MSWFSSSSSSKSPATAAAEREQKEGGGKAQQQQQQQEKALTMGEGKSIWFPLTAPPKNKEEADRLKQEIEKEKELGSQSLLNSRNQGMEAGKALGEAARLNCVDLEVKWRECLKDFSSDRFFTMCHSKYEAVKTCMEAQKRNLYRLDYHKKFMQGASNETLDKITQRADDMWLHQAPWEDE